MAYRASLVFSLALVGLQLALCNPRVKRQDAPPEGLAEAAAIGTFSELSAANKQEAEERFGGKENLEKALTDIKQNTTGAPAALKKFKEYAADTTTKFSNFFTEKKDTFVAKAKDLFTSMKSGVTGAWDSVMSMFGASTMTTPFSLPQVLAVALAGLVVGKW